MGELTSGVMGVDIQTLFLHYVACAMVGLAYGLLAKPIFVNLLKRGTEMLDGSPIFMWHATIVAQFFLLGVELDGLVGTGLASRIRGTVLGESIHLHDVG